VILFGIRIYGAGVRGSLSHSGSSVQRTKIEGGAQATELTRARHPVTRGGPAGWNDDGEQLTGHHDPVRDAGWRGVISGEGGGGALLDDAALLHDDVAIGGCVVAG
jgi:hypothetical protein